MAPVQTRPKCQGSIGETGRFSTLLIDGREYDAHFNVRSDLGEGIARWWAGKKSSNVGLQYLELKDGLCIKGPYWIERTDVIVVSGEQINVFVEADGSVTVQPYDEDEVSSNAKARARAAGEFAFKLAEEIGFIENEQKFFDEKPWKRCYGVAPEEAISILEPYAWNTRE